MKTIFRFRASARKAYSPLEILVILAIVVVVLSFVFGRPLIGYARTARIHSTKIFMHGFKSALQDFQSHASRFPSTAEGLQALRQKPADLLQNKWSGRYLDEKQALTDPFGTEYQYVCPSLHGNDYDLISAGPDKKFGTDDDISLFEEEPTDNR